MQSEKDIQFMDLAHQEAKKGLGHVSPNPLVGAVLVKNGELISTGYHHKSGMDHAEIDAIKNCKADLTGSTLYCNLEPCCHTSKKTLPCVPIIINSGISKVIISNLDPNPEVSGKGVELLRGSGIDVVVGALENEGKRLNEVFFHHIVTKKPFVHLKAAQTLDGKIQSITGDSKWISNEDSRKEAHKLRLSYDGVLIGRKTLNNDNPKLNIRMGIESNGKVPFRIILGKPCDFNWDSEILRSNLEKNIYLTNENISELDQVKQEVIKKGKLIPFSSLENSLEKLYQEGICSLLVEGGSSVLSSFLEEGLYNKLSLFQAPKLLGSGSGIFNSSISHIKDSLDLKILSAEVINNNLKIDLEKICLQE